MQHGALNLGMDTNFVIHTPLMWIDKAETWRFSRDLGGDALADLIREESHTCYQGDRTPHEWGRLCGICPACDLLAKGYLRFKGEPSSEARDLK